MAVSSVYLGLLIFLLAILMAARRHVFFISSLSFLRAHLWLWLQLPMSVTSFVYWYGRQYSVSRHLFVLFVQSSDERRQSYLSGHLKVPSADSWVQGKLWVCVPGSPVLKDNVYILPGYMVSMLDSTAFLEHTWAKKKKKFFNKCHFYLN